ncbi:Formin [Komagataella phaffii CBS 7435]|uniref:Formin, nucleates the formation of linear actin filaments n=2 Tax=Komagataella phaffii TaxID=460519 RepID=C4R8H1_KOMPG|nr:uncharacterized protein PAS_chr4_0636 [Komagataella phaffii GS115]AOA64972.1 GQ67_05012T0 [Komagataella phaffii]CAH2450702.1 Formin [Komagataella phaffii CBS 7435]AOA69730.1 GQ68_04993T0 [Komagataella phaffii GS115]CAY71896.1 Formin, nucleates the formation of linear actin filaments [Komagataella phaffii GS115]CCA40502.1 Formin [Komagataella phaffii CBS 7435]
MSNESTTKRFGWMKMKSKADPNPDPKLTGKGGVASSFSTANSMSQLSHQRTPTNDFSRKNSILSGMYDSDLRSVHTNTDSVYSANTSSTRYSSGTKNWAAPSKDSYQPERPSDTEVERLFSILMDQRDFKNLPSSARQELADYSVDKKWTLVAQDQIAEYKKNQRYQTHQKQYYEQQLALKNPTSAINPITLVTPELDKDGILLTPEYYVRKIISNTIHVNELSNLWVSLRTEPMQWVKKFLKAQGMVALGNVLGQLYKTSPLMSSKSTPVMFTNATEEYNSLLEKESILLRCLRASLNASDIGGRAAIESKIFSSTVFGALFSTRAANKKLAADMLAFLSNWRLNTEYGYISGYEQVWEAFTQRIGNNFHLKHQAQLQRNSKKKVTSSAQSTTSSDSSYIDLTLSDYSKMRYEGFLYSILRTLEGRGKMGSKVGASEEYKELSNSSENSVVEFFVSSMILINSLIQLEPDIRKRMNTRNSFKNAHLLDIFDYLRDFGNEIINDQIEKFFDYEAQDHQQLLQLDTLEDKNVDLNDPVSLVKVIWEKNQDSETQRYIKSMMQNLFMNQLDSEKADTGKGLNRTLKLIDRLVSNVSMAAAAASNDETALNITINRLFSSLQTDDVARKAIMEAREATKKAEEAIAERDELIRQMSMGSDGLVDQLKQELLEQEVILSKQRRQNEQIMSDLREARRLRMVEKQEQELEIRELLITLNSLKEKQALEHSNTEPVGAKDDRLKSRLLQQLEKKQIEYKTESRKYGGIVEPSKKLRSLRNQMEDIEREAKELEMTEFLDNDQKQGSPLPPSRPPKLDDLEKLEQLRQKLYLLQKDSNDVMKYQADLSQKDLYKKEKMLAMERLQTLQKQFKDLNIDFSLPPDSESEGYTMDPKFNERLIRTMDEVENISSELSNKLDLTDNKKRLSRRRSDLASIYSSTPSSRRGSYRLDYSEIEAKYTSGKVKQASSMDLEVNSNAPTTVETIKSKGMNPKFLSELSSKVAKTSTIEDPDSDSDYASNFNLEVNHKMRRHKNLKRSTDQSHSSSENDDSDAIIETKREHKDVNSAPTSISHPPSEELNATDKSIILSEDEKVASPKKKGPLVADKAPPPPSPPPLPSNIAGGAAPPPPPPPLPDIKGSVPLAPPPPPMAPPLLMKGDSPSPVPSPFLPSSPFADIPRPTKKLKQLHWEKIDDTNGSFWENTGYSEFVKELLAKGVFDEVENIFAAREIKKLTGRKKNDADKITFLQRDIYHRFEINLHVFNNLSDEELVLKLLRCDHDVMQNSHVLEFLGGQELVEIPTTLARNLEPYSTDWTTGERKQPEKDANELKRADRVYLELVYNLQHYWKSRIRALNVITTYEKDYQDLVQKLNLIEAATDALTNSTYLKQILDIILAVGNYMNDTSKQAQGFKLNTLQRLSFMKDDKNSMTFLHYVEKVVRTSYPELTAFIDELKPCVDASKIPVEQIQQECKEYINSIKNVDASLEVGNLSESSKFHPEDRVLVKVLPRMPTARRKSNLLDDQLVIVIDNFEKLMSFFGEDATDQFAKNSFFKKFADFVSDFQRASRENIQREEEQRLYEQRKKLMETPKKSEVVAAVSDDAASPVSDNVVDDLLKKLKAVGPTRGDPQSARRRALARRNLAETRKNVNSVSLSSASLGIPYDGEDALNDSIENADAVHDNSEGDDIESRAMSLLKGIRSDSDATTEKTKGSGHTSAQEYRKMQRSRRLQEEREGNSNDSKSSLQNISPLKDNSRHSSAVSLVESEVPDDGQGKLKMSSSTFTLDSDHQLTETPQSENYEDAREESI